MLTDYLIITASITAATLLWRTLQDDHPSFKAAIERLPLMGSSLICGVCVSFWFSLPIVIAYNPLIGWHPALSQMLAQFLPALVFLAGWLSVSLGVLFARSATIVLLEGGAILKHKHRSSHAGQ
ncbi:MAG TPA: hypothetical protein VG753_02485 [Candidatus Paceibacterota bacterium]|nr:hypothetical protein [Candidatus Paceibacterota bacterium]